MDIKLQVASLREHSEQLVKLSLALRADLRKLEGALHELESTPDLQAVRLLVGVGDLNSSLFSATDVFCQRLHRLLNSATISNGLCPNTSQNPRAVS
jgi:hypothetical protein